ncbi:MAG TPA: DegT/DnrJ/EryC1/StrS family aminotransferase [Candidatus Sulfotelmatobacter sp.]|nr:DegT/DnrJ/EryC1/StrS family aminotransferase [Candidatus Sulfotelmatobacter sp.]
MKRINVTKTFLPPIEEYQSYLDSIWSSSQLTNQGPLLLEFEEKTKEYLGLKNLQAVANGTLALQLAIRALDLGEGEIITTPFSYVATTSAILWEHFTPVFVDIDRTNFCLDANKIERAITDKTKAIMPVHVFGLPCNVEEIDQIAKKHNLKVIYDGAHAFGVKYRGKSLLDYGDISTCSFHATKLFHTIEGGAAISNNEEINRKVDLQKRFGHHGDEHIMLGINAKLTEFQAAMGLCNLKYIDENINKRKQLYNLYSKLLAGRFEVPTISADTIYNYGYYPVLAENEKQLTQLIDKLGHKEIYPRRYFYPSLNNLPYIDKRQKCPVSEDIASRIMCLPLYADLEEQSVEEICEALK